MRHRTVKIGLSALILIIVLAIGYCLGIEYEIHDSQTRQDTPKIATANTPDELSTVDLQAVEYGVNQKRVTAGLPPLVNSVALTDAATNRCNDMAVKQYYSHTAPDGTPWYASVQQLTTYKNAGENLEAFWTDFSINDVINRWMASPEHKANILSSSYTNTGLASCEGLYQDKDTVFIVEEFDN